jgi:hypothetical protein
VSAPEPRREDGQAGGQRSEEARTSFFVQGELRRGKADRDGKVGSMRVQGGYVYGG